MDDFGQQVAIWLEREKDSVDQREKVQRLDALLKDDTSDADSLDELRRQFDVEAGKLKDLEREVVERKSAVLGSGQLEQVERVFARLRAAAPPDSIPDDPNSPSDFEQDEVASAGTVPAPLFNNAAQPENEMLTHSIWSKIGWLVVTAAVAIGGTVVATLISTTSQNVYELNASVASTDSTIKTIKDTVGKLDTTVSDKVESQVRVFSEAMTTKITGLSNKVESSIETMSDDNAKHAKSSLDTFTSTQKLVNEQLQKNINLEFKESLGTALKEERRVIGVEFAKLSRTVAALSGNMEKVDKSLQKMDGRLDEVVAFIKKAHPPKPQDPGGKPNANTQPGAANTGLEINATNGKDMLVAEN